MLTDALQMIIAGDAHPGNQHAHAKGVAAILRIENSPLDLFGAVRSGHPSFLNGAARVRILFLSSVADS